MKFTNYTIQVLAFTNGGDGVLTEVLSATTEQDIPGPPSSVKALAMSGTAFSINSIPRRGTALYLGGGEKTHYYLRRSRKVYGCRFFFFDGVVVIFGDY